MSRMAEMFAEHEQDRDEENALQAEIHFRTLNILEYLSEVLKPEDFSLMCYHCGVSVNHFNKEQ